MSKIIQITVGDMMTNCYLLQSADEIAVIDPGFEGTKIINTAATLSGTIKYIINTHGHVDHIGANKTIKELTGAKIYIHKDDAELLIHPSKNLSLLLGEFVSSPPADIMVEEGDIIKVGDVELIVYHTPGHTKGGICLIGDKIAFTGDTLFFDSIGRTDFPDASEEKMIESLKRLQLLISDDTIVYPGHGDWGKFSEIKRVNPFLFIEK